MMCYDVSNNVYYPRHSEFVEAGNVHGVGLGFCERCHEILDHELVQRLAHQGHPRCQDVLAWQGASHDH